MLVTHQLQFLTDCSKILVLKDNKQVAYGDFKAITESGFDITEILQSHNKALNEEIRAVDALDCSIPMKPKKLDPLGKTIKSGERRKEEDVDPKDEKKVNLIIAEEQDTGGINFADL